MHTLSELDRARAEAASGLTPFLLEGDDRGILCVHGFTGTPFEIGYLGRSLHRLTGATVSVLRLPGHGTHPEQLDATSWRDWVAAVADAFERLRERSRIVAVAGQSLGGLLSLNLAADRPAEVAGVISLAAPLWLYRMPTALVRAFRRFPALTRLVPNLPKLDGSDVLDETMKAVNPSYPVIPVRGLLQLDEFMARVRKRLPEVTVPLLAVHARKDHTAPYGSVEEIVRSVRSEVVERLDLERSYHLIAFDVERDEVAAAAAKFLERLPGWSAA